MESGTALRMLASSPVLLLCTRSEHKANVMPLSRYCVVSEDPVRVVLSLAPSRFSRRLLEHSGDFVLSVPDVTLIDDVHYCGLYSGRQLDKFRVRELATTQARETSPLLVAGAIGQLECRLAARRREGDRLLYTGEVCDARPDREYWDNGWRDDANLLFHLGADRYLVGERVMRARQQRDPRYAIIAPTAFDDPWRAPEAAAQSGGDPL